MLDRAWTLILWDIENVPIPDQLRNPAGVKQLRELLKDKFGKLRRHQLHCMKLACRWPDYRSPYANLLGLLTTLGDVEALGYQWQGQKDKTHNADRLLKQAADRFMHMLEDHNGPEHLVVFITSDEDFGEKVLELQRRNFKVIVVYHEPHTTQRPVSIINTADEAYAWLPFLRRELGIPQLSISDYDANVYHIHNSSQAAAATSGCAQAQAAHRFSPYTSGFKVQAPPAPSHQLAPPAAPRHPALPATPSHPAITRRPAPPSPPATPRHPASPRHPAPTKHPQPPRSPAAPNHPAPSNRSASLRHPAPPGHYTPAHTLSMQDTSAQKQDIKLLTQADQEYNLLYRAIQKSHPAKSDELLRTVADACLTNGLQKSSETHLHLFPVNVCIIGALLKHRHVAITGKLLPNLMSEDLSPYLELIAGRQGAQPSILLKLPQLILKEHKIAQISQILARLQIRPMHLHSSVPATSGSSSTQLLPMQPAQQTHAALAAAAVAQAALAAPPASCSAPAKANMPEDTTKLQDIGLSSQDGNADQEYASLYKAIQRSHSAKDDELLCTVANACLAHGLKRSSECHLQLLPVSVCQIGAVIRQQGVDMTGQLLLNLEGAALSSYVEIIAGPDEAQPAVLLKLAKLIHEKHKTIQVRQILSEMHSSAALPRDNSVKAATSDDIWFRLGSLFRKS